MFINAIFHGDYDITLAVHPRCANLIGDLSGLKMDANGVKLKTKERHPISGVSFEKYGHTSDSMDYFLCKVFEKEFERYQYGR